MKKIAIWLCSQFFASHGGVAPWPRPKHKIQHVGDKQPWKAVIVSARFYLHAGSRDIFIIASSRKNQSAHQFRSDKRRESSANCCLESIGTIQLYEGADMYSVVRLT